MSKRIREKRRRTKIWPFELLIGIILIGGVFLIATSLDMADAQHHLSGTVNYIREQCNRYDRMNLASETKSLMRVIQSAQQIQRNLPIWKIWTRNLR